MDIEVNNIATYGAKKLENHFKQAPIDYLHELKVYLDDKYYNTGTNSGLTDVQYDLLKEILVERDPTYDPLVGAKVPEDEAVDMPYCMGSMDKIKNTEPKKLTNWLNKNKADDYIIEDKLDGVSCLLVSNNGKISLYKRGDNCIGKDITEFIKYFKSIPTKLPDIVVRGELVMSTTIFTEKYSDNANPRNFVNGRTSGKVARDGIEDIDFVTYEIINKDHNNNQKPSTQLKKLRDLGFLVVNHETLAFNDIEPENLTNKLVSFKDTSPYELDGLILYSDKSYERTEDKYPKYARAFKVNFEEDIKETKVLYVKWTVGKYRTITPVVYIEPVLVLGGVLKHPTGHNAAYIRDHNIGPGTIVRVTRSNSVIPYIVSVVKPTKAQMPDIPYKWGETEVHIYTEEESDAVFIKKITSFFSQLGIKHLGEATVTKLYENGFNTVFKILEADKSTLLKIPRFGKKTVERLYDNIHEGLTNVSPAAVLAASGAFDCGIGLKRMDVLMSGIPNVLQLYKEISSDELLDMIVDLEGFSYKIGQQLVTNMQAADEFMVKLSKYATFKEIRPRSKSRKSPGKLIMPEASSSAVINKLDGGKFVMSGFRNNFLHEKIGIAGGDVTSAVSRKTTALIVKDKSDTTTKITKAKNLEVPIYTLDEFLTEYKITLP